MGCVQTPPRFALSYGYRAKLSARESGSRLDISKRDRNSIGLENYGAGYRSARCSQLHLHASVSVLHSLVSLVDAGCNHQFPDISIKLEL